MRWETLKASIDFAFHVAAKEIRILYIGGEPLLEWPLIPKTVEYVHSSGPPGKNVRYEVSTNGLFISDDVLEFLDENAFTVQLSFDGIPEAQDYRGAGTFAALDGVLDRMRERYPNLFLKNLQIAATQIPAAIPCLADSMHYFIEKGIRQIAISPSLTPSPGWSEEGIQTLEDQFRRIYEDSLRHLESTGEVPLVLFRKLQGAESLADPEASCSASKGNMLAVDADGQVYGCVMFAESYQEFPSEFLKRQLRPLRMGALRDGGFPERYAAYQAAVLTTDIFRGIEKRYSAYGKCADCPYRDSCWVCPVSIGYLRGNSDPHRVPDFICAFNRVALKYRDLFPCTPDPLEPLNAVLERIIASAPK